MFTLRYLISNLYIHQVQDTSARLHIIFQSFAKNNILQEGGISRKKQQQQKKQQNGTILHHY